jgi:pyruvate dehydrogenase E2 component (dihydrolipoamide acetyltransferase)
MPAEFKIPELGENVASGDVVRVLVKAGETVAKDQPVLELETDKATIEVPSDVSGTIREIKVKKGDKVKVGQVVFTLDDGTSVAAKGRPAGETAADKGASQPEPQPAGGAAEGGLSQAAPGAAEETAAGDRAGAARAERERDRGTVTSAPEGRRAGSRAAASAEASEEPPQRQKPRGEVVEISRGSRPAAAAQAPAAEAPTEGPVPPAAPSVRRLARELGVDIRRVSGSGTDGRITLDDVQAYVRTAMAGGVPPAEEAPAAEPLPDFARWGEVERKAMSNIRRRTSERLAHAWNTIPHVTQHDKADITALEALRMQYGPHAEKAGGKLTVTAIALKVVAGALRRFPQFNASIDTARGEIAFKKSIHVGVAVDTERGLLVPVVRDVDGKGILELSVELAKLSEKARAGKLSLDEMQGGGFTITNLGGIGGTSFTPIVNWPEVAILGISRGSQEPVWNGQAFEPRLMLPLSLSYDHRVIDGADAARFLRWVAEAFEQPLVMVL